MLLKDFLEKLDRLCPFELQEEWDNTGLQIGNGESEIDRVLVAFDFTEAVLAEAIEKKVQLVLTHHPFFFRSIRTIDLNTAKGRMIGGLIRNDIALVSCHTNLDKISGYGVGAVLGKLLKLENCRPFLDEGNDIGFGIVGELPAPCLLEEFALEVKKALNLPAVHCVGAKDRPVSTVAAMGGTGNDFLLQVKDCGADVYVTADLQYHDGQAAAEMDLALIDAGHFTSEAPTMEYFTARLKETFPETEFLIAESMADYWHFC